MVVKFLNLGLVRKFIIQHVSGKSWVWVLGPGLYKIVTRNQTLTNPTRPVLLHQSRVGFGATDDKPRGAFDMVCVIYINWVGFGAEIRIQPDLTRCYPYS